VAERAFRVPAAVLHEAGTTLVAAFPYEACGWLVRRAAAGADAHSSAGWRTVPIRNALRTADPAAARRRFEMAPEELVRVVRDVDRRGEQLAAMFHGHPEGASTISPSDAAAWAPGGYPLYPTAVLLIGAVYRDVVAEWRAYQWRHGRPETVPVVPT